jgi:hypothetical protein
MEKEEKKVLTNEQKMEILQGLHEIIWEANRMIGKLAKSDSTEFDYDEFKHELWSHCNFLFNDTHSLMNIKL